MQAIHPRFRSVSGGGGWRLRGLDRLSAAAGGVDDGGGGGVGGGNGGGLQAQEGHEREEAGSAEHSAATLAQPTLNYFWVHHKNSPQFRVLGVLEPSGPVNTWLKVWGMCYCSRVSNGFSKCSLSPESKSYSFKPQRHSHIIFYRDRQIHKPQVPRIRG